MVVSCMLLFHVLAVFMAPFRFSTTTGPAASPSPFAQSTLFYFDWYIQLTFLDHGYAFFAPDPGPSYLIRYEVEFDDGRPPLVKTFPSLSDQWPRLLYHRHFMLSEQLNMKYVPRDLDANEQRNPLLVREHRERRQLYDLQREAFRRHLEEKYNAASVKLTQVEHGLAADIDVLEGMRLDDPRLYRDLSETANRRGPASTLPEQGP